MVEPGATDYHVSRRGEIDQPHAVWRSCQVEAELSDSGTKDIILPNLCVEIPEHNLDVRVEGILDRIVLLLAFLLLSSSFFCLPFAPLCYPPYFLNGGDVSPAFYEGVRQPGRGTIPIEGPTAPDAYT